MFRRRSPVTGRGPGLAGTVARTAVIAGTATATSNAVNNRQMQRQQQRMASQAADPQAVARLEQQVEDLQAQQVQANLGANAPAANASPDIADQLGKLVELRQTGLLTDEEFAAAKARVLGS
jgi:hypothetical protein